jgi:hypothetical protein
MKDPTDEIMIGLDEGELDELKDETEPTEKVTLAQQIAAEKQDELEEIEGLVIVDDAYGIEIEPLDIHIKVKQPIIPEKDAV